jgi:tellurite resistance protein
MTAGFHVSNLISKATPIIEAETFFDYSRIDDEALRASTKVAAQRIHENNRVVEKSFLANGRILLETKADLSKAGDRLWTDWLEEEFQWSTRTAQNYMAVAEKFGDAYHEVCYLPSPIIYALASGKAMDDARAKVIEAAQTDEPMQKDAVKELIQQFRQSPRKKAEKPDAGTKAARKAIELIGDRLGKDVAEIAKLILKAGPSFAKELRSMGAL